MFSKIQTRALYYLAAMFDTERFISEIEKRPAIYNTNCDEYNDRTAKLAAWDEVCQVMIRNWPTLSDEERIVEGKKEEGKMRMKKKKLNCVYGQHTT